MDIIKEINGAVSVRIHIIIACPSSDHETDKCMPSSLKDLKVYEWSPTLNSSDLTYHQSCICGSGYVRVLNLKDKIVELQHATTDGTNGQAASGADRFGH